MKVKFFSFLMCLAISASISAKTYTLKSGKWTDPAIWGNDYPGTVVKAQDVVVVEGSVLMNASVTVEGTLWIEKGAALVGFKNLTIALSGKLVNNGNTVMERIINEGHIVNNRSLDAIADIDNKGSIENASNLVAGNDFNNVEGTVTGEKSTFFAQNNIITSPDSKFGPGVRFFYGNNVEKSKDSSSITQDASAKETDSQIEINKILQLQQSLSAPK